MASLFHPLMVMIADVRFTSKRPVKATLKDQATWSLARRSYRK